MNFKEQIIGLSRNFAGYTLVITSFAMIFFIMQINVELDVYLAFFLALFIMFLLYVIISMMYLIQIKDGIYNSKKEILSKNSNS